MGIIKNQLYELRNVIYSLDGTLQGSVVDLSLSERLRMLRDCDSEGRFNPVDFAPYEDDIRKRVYMGWMKEPNQRFKKAKEGKVEEIVFGNDYNPESYEVLSFSEWVSIGKPPKLTIRKEYQKVK